MDGTQVPPFVSVSGCQLARGLGLGEGCVVPGGGRRASGVGRGGRVTSLHGDVLRGIHQLALTKGAGGPRCGRLRPRRREGLFVCLFPYAVAAPSRGYVGGP
jgi:hypothetical protein